MSETQELIDYVIRALVDKPDEVQVTAVEATILMQNGHPPKLVLSAESSK